MTANDYGMPMSPRPEGTAVGTDATSGATWQEPPHPPPLGIHRPHGLVELRDQAGTFIGDIARTAGGLTIYNPKLKDKVGDGACEFNQPVFVPWGAVLYWSVSKGQNNE